MKGKSSIRNNGDTRAAAGAENPCPLQRSNYNNNDLTHMTGGAQDMSASHHRTSDISCYKCGGKGHISSDPSCLQYGKPSTNPQFNAQCVMEDEDPETEHHPQDEDGDELGSQHSNSWEGSQYDPQDNNKDELEYQEVIPEGEDADNASEAEQVHMSSMRMVCIFALHRVTEEESDLPEPEEHPQEGQPHEEVDSNNELDPINAFHQEDPILDPVHIEYQDSIIYRREPNQTEEQPDADLQQAAMGATCMVCH
jgi:hypothetical protein